MISSVVSETNVQPVVAVELLMVSFLVLVEADNTEVVESSWVLRCEPVDVSGFRGGLVVVRTVSGSLEGTVDNFMELSDEGLFTSLVVRYRVVLPGLNQPVVVLGTSVDP